MRYSFHVLATLTVLLAAATAAQVPDSPPTDIASDARAEPLTWDNLERRLEKEVQGGFSGVILVVREGEPVIRAAYGMANKERGIPNRYDTIFGIGSTPIDFTHVGILLLAQQGKLSLDDPITEFFDDVPADKRGITIEHLRTSRSGLQDFLGRSEDGNPDHTWIDRDEAMRRIFEDELLFEPGAGRRHSHAAWGVLAAIIEIVSGETYQEFTAKNIFKPLGMKDTGFYGQPLAVERTAIGYGLASNGEVNAPPFWGPTSWLVLGSGGQVSTVPDMHRFVVGMRGGALLEALMRERLLSTWRGLLAGGSIFGYEILYTTNPDNMMILVSNDNPDGGNSPAVAFGEALGGLADASNGPRFSLGVGLEFDPEQGLRISRVVSGSAAERDGLKAGDVIVAAGGESLGDDPLAVLDPYLQSGEKIQFDIERAGTPMKVTVKPNPR